MADAIYKGSSRRVLVDDGAVTRLLVVPRDELTSVGVAYAVLLDAIGDERMANAMKLIMASQVFMHLSKDEPWAISRSIVLALVKNVSVAAAA